ncbi:conserved exported hypothetical protein [Flavobacterium sp. 9AF]|uniref:DUF5689 domain-containing protein n=1 Tax=Flavobacterium sp. 9AF TaxID=2653142 RepID=UPI0012F31339|nr:DUF5689 domain-containing protein [Flavobacterium sp. 9AF]VXB38211.1 conserved exported hypothetical protein [Flavobacterium sp. 9AF]
MKKLKFILTTVLIVTLSSCVTGDDYNAPDLSGECVTKTANTDIEGLADNATTTPTLWDLANGNILEAYVTSSDEGGNFYKTISMVAFDANDNEYGFTVPVDEYNLFNIYEPGRKVYIDLTDLYTKEDDYTDDLQIGQLFGNDIGRIGLEKYKNKIYRSCDKKDEEELVHHIGVNEAHNLQYLHTLVEFENVQFDDLSLGHTYFDRSLNASPTWTGTNHTIKDKFGNNIILRASEFATFAGDAIPSGNGKIRGVLTKYGNDYQLMIRTINDVQLTNDRYVPSIIFQETFTTNFPNWIAYSVTGPSQVWGLSSAGSSPNVPYANINGGTTTPNEDWLISPVIDLTNISTAFLTFETAGRYLGPILEVKVSNNYTGTGNPNSATWIDYTSQANYPTITSSSFSSFVSSGGIDISSNFAGQNNIRIAFKYTSLGTGSGSSTNWEVDNVRVLGQ